MINDTVQCITVVKADRGGVCVDSGTVVVLVTTDGTHIDSPTGTKTTQEPIVRHLLSLSVISSPVMSWLHVK